MVRGADIRIIAVPYDSGHRALRMGRGPEYLLENELSEVLRSEDRKVRSATLHPESDLMVEVATAFQLNRQVSGEVHGALAEGEFPLVLSGNCNTSVGTLSGVDPEGLGIVWFDAHADFNIPETTTTGFSDGMGLAIAVGHCWEAMARGVPGFSPVAEDRVVLAGARDVESAERKRLAASEVTVIGSDRIEQEGLQVLGTVLDELEARVGRVYMHLDLDVLDAVKVGRANEFASENGLSAEKLEAALGMVRERFDVAACGIASFDPAFDLGGRVLGAAISCARAVTSPV